MRAASVLDVGHFGVLAAVCVGARHKQRIRARFPDLFWGDGVILRRDR